MKYEIEMTLNIPRERVIELFDDPDNLAKWQEGFLKLEHYEGERGQVGAKSRIDYRMGKRDVQMIETIVKRDLPHEFHGTYESGGVWNRIENFFTVPEAGKTHWRLTSEFRCKGVMAVMAFLFPGMFRKMTRKYMEDFKRFAEAEGA